MKHIAVYQRVSTEDQTTASQLPDLMRYLENETGPVKWYEPDNFTGRQMSRPRFDEVLADIRAGRVSKLVVWRLDRLGRTCAGLTRLFEELRERGVDLVSVRDGFDLNTPAGRLQAQILASVAEFETEIRAERVRAGINRARQQHDLVRKLAAQGRTPEQIAVETRIRLETVRKILGAPTKAGLYWGGKPKGSGMKTQASHDRVRDLLLRGLKVEEVAGALGVSLRTIKNRIKSMGGMKAIRMSAAAQPEPELANGRADEQHGDGDEGERCPEYGAIARAHAPQSALG